MEENQRPREMTSARSVNGRKFIEYQLEDGSIAIFDEESGTPLCGHAKRNCSERMEDGLACGYRYPRDSAHGKWEEWEVQACPRCGGDRRCLSMVSEVGELCNAHQQNRKVRMVSKSKEKRSRYLTGKLSEVYVNARAVPVHELFDEIAITRTYRDIHLTQISEAQGDLEDIVDLVKRCQKWLAKGNIEKGKELVEKMLEVIDANDISHTHWKEVVKLNESIAELSKSQIKILKDTKRMIDMGVLLLRLKEIFQLVFDALDKYVQDPAGVSLVKKEMRSWARDIIGDVKVDD